MGVDSKKQQKGTAEHLVLLLNVILLSRLIVWQMPVTKPPLISEMFWGTMMESCQLAPLTIDR